jgi:hypothetical protein
VPSLKTISPLPDGGQHPDPVRPVNLRRDHSRRLGDSRVGTDADPRVDAMKPQEHGYVALANQGPSEWHVFVLDLTVGLVGSTVARTLDQVEPAARAVLQDLFQRPPSSFKVTVVQR